MEGITAVAKESRNSHLGPEEKEFWSSARVEQSLKHEDYRSIAQLVIPGELLYLFLVLFAFFCVYSSFRCKSLMLISTSTLKKCPRIR
jgi:hypothetical protein